MALSGDLSSQALAAALGERPVRGFPALLSSDAEARAWARAGAPAGAVVVADYQAAARGRGGLPWTCRPGRDLCLSVILRPQTMTPDDEGWLFLAAALAVGEAVAPEAALEWPDRVATGERPVAEVAGHAGLGPAGVDWAIVNVLVLDAPAPRAALAGRIAAALETVQEPEDRALGRYRERCATLGREVVATVAPLWPEPVRVAGTAVAVLRDGALVVRRREDGRRLAVRPQHLARIDVGETAQAGD